MMLHAEIESLRLDAAEIELLACSKSRLVKSVV
jgi:hypothetical protein